MIDRASRSFAFLLSLAVASVPLHVLAQPAAAQAEIAAGDASTRGKDFNAALAHYRNAFTASPSGRAQMGVADALYNLGRVGESYEAYNDAQNNFGPKLGPVERALIAKRLHELAAKTGWLSIRLTENGAAVDVDGRGLGTSPVPALVRVPAGSHEVHVNKAGFAPFTAKIDIVADGTAVVEPKLVPLNQTGHVVVHASGPEALRVTVDGVDVGSTPWEGDLPPGPHAIAGRSGSALAEAQNVDVTAGSRTAVDLVSSATAAHIQVRTNDGQGSIYVDGVVKGQGAFSGDVAPGPHTIVVTRDGFERYEKAMTLGERQTFAETVTLQPAVAAGPTEVEGDRGLQGIYGGFGLMGAFGLGSGGTELATSCSSLGASSCSTPGAVGGGGFGYIGYTWDPVGFELFLFGMGDSSTQKAEYSGASSSSANALVPASLPARTETFTFVRGGGAVAVRARATFQTRRLRGTIAGGVGLSYREMIMKRSAVDTAGDTSTYVPPNSAGYVSPALSLEAAFHYRISQTLGIAVGLEVFADNASIAGTNSVPANQALPIGTSGATIPSPSYHLATGPQVTLGPFLGLAFGP
ncbi:MAG TPA: PEGA domain-containing protein [Polyangiaceae bacterium]